MPSIYWLTGAIGAGKSTLGAALASSMPHTVFVDGDFLVPNADELEFSIRIEVIKSALIEACERLVSDGHSVVVAYPLASSFAKELKNRFQARDVRFVIIGIALPTQSANTRGYSVWEQNRQKEMSELSGNGYADVIFHHPSPYLYDSLEHLKAQLAQPNTVA